MPQRFDVIFWDFDGTLAHSRHLWTNSICDALKQADPGTGIGFDQLRPLTRACYPWDQPEENYRRLQGTEWWSYMEKQFARAYEQAGVKTEIAWNAAARVRGEILRPEKYHLFEDTFWALEYCRKEGCRNVLLSNNYPELEEITAVLGLTPWLDGMVVSGQVGWDKPRPEIFRLALEQAGKGARCLMVGDNPVADIQGARNCGIPAALVHKEADCDADYHSDTLRGVVEQIFVPSEVSGTF